MILEPTAPLVSKDPVEKTIEKPNDAVQQIIPKETKRISDSANFDLLVGIGANPNVVGVVDT